MLILTIPIVKPISLTQVGPQQGHPWRCSGHATSQVIQFAGRVAVHFIRDRGAEAIAGVPRAFWF
jgi:hypothetical protein